jgi:hypothetical protein
MESENEGNSKNWLKEHVTDRSSERMREGMKQVFDRIRVVEKLFAHDDEEEKLSQAELEKKAVIIIEKYNLDMKDTIRVTSQETKDDPERGFYYVPLDTSEEVIREGARWFLELKKIGKDGLKFENIGIDALVRKLYLVMASKGMAEEILEKSSGNPDLSNVVTEMIGRDEDIPIPRAVGKAAAEVGMTEKASHAAFTSLERAQNNLMIWISSISPDINRLYASSAFQTDVK